MSNRIVWSIIVVICLIFWYSVIQMAHAEPCPVDTIQRVKDGAYTCENWVYRFGRDSLITDQCLDLNRNAGILKFVYRYKTSCAPYIQDIDYIYEEYQREMEHLKNERN